MGLTIGVDIGGTKVLGGIVDETGKVLATTRRPTPADDVARTRDVIVEVVRELAEDRQIDAVGIGAAGWIDADRSTVLFAPNLAWRDEPLRDAVSAGTGLPVIVENDANVAAWAEFRYGAAEDAADSMVLFTIGTGIGGGIILGGRLIRGAHGIAAELGHVQAVPGGHPCGCGRHGCIEQYASGSALVRYAQTGVKDDTAAGAALLDQAGGDVGAITGPMVTEAALSGDALAIDAFRQAGTWLGVAMADMVQLLDPQVIVVGGGVVEAGDLLMKPALVSYQEQLAQRAKSPIAEVRPAKMGNLAGIVGAADLARS
ncbi:MAG: ROK family glucokinase [Hamadaea sp.]|uniref:ROK family glucokinase n=1 Tax=Hamadaea sp. TaxID=2024425 RepID=UPI00182841CA|nr:ROK family glucokinase [Hamadaea sp.]NUR72611.1 ROK family glucokinase [Hamadaea sp.]NUT23094.1 ROK family glucokinase [Hamadaea sp.]